MVDTDVSGSETREQSSVRSEFRLAYVFAAGATIALGSPAAARDAGAS